MTTTENLQDAAGDTISLAIVNDDASEDAKPLLRIGGYLLTPEIVKRVQVMLDVYLRVAGAASDKNTSVRFTPGHLEFCDHIWTLGEQTLCDFRVTDTLVCARFRCGAVKIVTSDIQPGV